MQSFIERSKRLSQVTPWLFLLSPGIAEFQNDFPNRSLVLKYLVKVLFLICPYRKSIFVLVFVQGLLSMEK